MGKRGKSYTEQQKQWIKEKSQERGMNNKKLTKLFNETFGEKRRETAIATMRNKLGVKLQRRYTDEQIQFLKEAAKAKGLTNAKLTKMFNEKFNEHKSAAAIANIRSEHGIILNNRRAKKMEGSNLRGSKPIGHERIRKEYVEIKVGQPNKWMQKHRYIWEKHNRELKKGEVVIFLDNDNRNFNIDNLAVVERKELARLNYRSLITENRELTKTGINVVKLEIKARELEREKI